MNRYPLWKYVVMLVALVIGFVYTLPNFFGEAPAVQVSSGKATVKLDSGTLAQVPALRDFICERASGALSTGVGFQARMSARRWPRRPPAETRSV